VVNGRLCRSLEDLPKPVDGETALRIIKGVAQGLAYAHSRGVSQPEAHCEGDGVRVH